MLGNLLSSRSRGRYQQLRKKLTDRDLPRSRSSFFPRIRHLLVLAILLYVIYSLSFKGPAFTHAWQRFKFAHGYIPKVAEYPPIYPLGDCLRTHPIHKKPTWNGTTAAVIIEPRALNNLKPILLHFNAVLGPHWPIVLFTSEATAASTVASPAIRRLMHRSMLFVEILPERYDFSARSTVSDFLTEPWLWDALVPAEKVLLFQTDSIICANSPRRVEDFLQYDFVGAPIHHGSGRGFNGGLSLRNRRMVADITRTEVPFRATWRGDGKAKHLEFEDQWFYYQMGERGARLPSRDVAGRFSVEQVWYERPLGYHQIQSWQAHMMGIIEDWCPEVRLTAGRTLEWDPPKAEDKNKPEAKGKAGNKGETKTA